MKKKITANIAFFLFSFMSACQASPPVYLPIKIVSAKSNYIIGGNCLEKGVIKNWIWTIDPETGNKISEEITDNNNKSIGDIACIKEHTLSFIFDVNGVLLPTKDQSFLNAYTPLRPDFKTKELIISKKNADQRLFWRKTVQVPGKEKDIIIGSLAELPENQILFLTSIGNYHNFTPDDSQMWLFTCSSEGKLSHQCFIDTAGIPYPNNHYIACLENSFIVSCMKKKQESSSGTALIIRYEHPFKELWKREINNISPETSPKIIPFNHSLFLAVSKLHKPYILKITSENALLWEKSPNNFFPEGIFEIRDIFLDQRQLLILGTVFFEPNKNNQVFLLKMNLDEETFIWNKVY